MGSQRGGMRQDRAGRRSTYLDLLLSRVAARLSRGSTPFSDKTLPSVGACIPFPWATEAKAGRHAPARSTDAHVGTAHGGNTLASTLRR